MKIVQINGGVFGSTGTIMFGIADTVAKGGGETICFSPITVSNRHKKPETRFFNIGTFHSRRLNVILDRLTGFSNCFAVFSTLGMIRKISAFHPDVIHLHTLHESYVNLSMLFRYIKRQNIPVVWTLHDCWAFTGHCPHFGIVDCDKWMTGCHDCPSYHEYPKSLVDNSKIMWKLKRKWFTGVSDLTIVTPSRWLAELADRSFLRDYPVKVINNGIDLSVFKPTSGDFRKKYGLGDKHIVLGVAFGWTYKKGLDVFIELVKRLDSEKYAVVIVGTSDDVDVMLPDGIISVHRTSDQIELAEIYTAADVFVNPTREESFGLVNAESLACGTPVITFKTGGSPEIIDKSCGSVVDKGDVDMLESEILRICETIPYTQNACRSRAAFFDKNNRFEEYVDLYASLIDH